MVAQKLYENGFITYMRTDSTRLSDDAKKIAKNYIEKNYGKVYHLDRVYKTKDSAQDAHEAIRPSKLDANTSSFNADEQKLYTLIVNRFLASQMAVAVYDTTKVPIIMLTARGEEQDELFGFELGADEYISKPFSPKILVARVEAILNRTRGNLNEVKDYGGIEIDIDGRTVKVDGKEVGVLSWNDKRGLAEFQY